MATKSMKLSDALKKSGKTREFVKTMSDEEIRRRALGDPDNPPLTDEQLVQFRLGNEMDRQAIKREALRNALLKTGKFRNGEIEAMSAEEMQCALASLRVSDGRS